MVDCFWCYITLLTLLQLLWTDPQEMPGRGPSKRVRSLRASLYHVSPEFPPSRELALRLGQMSRENGAQLTVLLASFAATRFDKV